MKQSITYFLISAFCIAGYFILDSSVKKQPIETPLSYKTDSASEVYLVWGLMNGKTPDSDQWPDNSQIKDNLLWSKMNRAGSDFHVILKLPPQSLIYYWMVQKKDLIGNEMETWDAGSENAPYFTYSIPYTGVFKPGYFILLAGVIPLIIHFLQHKKKPGGSIGNFYKLTEYVTQFDSLRAIAVLLVIIHHWLPEDHFLNQVPNGRIGVNIFFVLSGFLITGILLKAKIKIDEIKLNARTALKNFYIRRTLRIFPIYYLVLFIFYILNNPELKENAIYYLTYTSNYLFYFKEGFPGNFAHLWSLAVEEQFYIIWPCLIIFLNKKYLPYLICTFIFLGISTNYIVTGHGWWVEILTPACFDAFAIGGILAYYGIYRQDIIKKIDNWYAWVVIPVVLLFLMDCFRYPLLPARTSHALFAAVIIFYSVFKRNNKLMNTLLNSKLLISIGKISYGIYLYHLFIPSLWKFFYEKAAYHHFDLLFSNVLPVEFNSSFIFIQEFILLILICVLSWKFIEKPINNLKKRFENDNNRNKPIINAKEEVFKAP